MVIGLAIRGALSAAKFIPRAVGALKGNPALVKIGSGIVSKTSTIAGKIGSSFAQRPIRSVVSVVSGVSAAKAVSGLLAPKPPPVKIGTSTRNVYDASKKTWSQMTDKELQASRAAYGWNTKSIKGGVGTGAVIGAGAVLGGAALAAKNKTTAGKIPVVSDIINFAQKNPALTAVIGAGAAAAIGGAILARRKKKKAKGKRRVRGRRGRRVTRRRGRRVSRFMRSRRRRVSRSPRRRVSFTTKDGRKVSFTPRARGSRRRTRHTRRGWAQDRRLRSSEPWEQRYIRKRR